MLDADKLQEATDMIEINGSALTQWDVGRSVKITGIEVECVHFANKGDSKAVIIAVDDSNAIIPNYLLQTGKDLCVYAVKDGVTVESNTFYVKKRERPENYVYDDDQRNYIYELITNAEQIIRDASNAANEAENAVESANQAADRANDAAAKVEEYIAAGGIDGFSPIAKATQTENGAVITITDKYGTTTATVTNGKDGKDGAKGEKGDTGATGPQGEKGEKGDTGAAGKDGKDGYTPQKGIDYFDGKDGANGKDGQDGAPGADGKDYVLTEADKEEIAQMTADQLPTYDGTYRDIYAGEVEDV